MPGRALGLVPEPPARSRLFGVVRRFPLATIARCKPLSKRRRFDCFSGTDGGIGTTSEADGDGRFPKSLGERASCIRSFRLVKPLCTVGYGLYKKRNFVLALTVRRKPRSKRCRSDCSSR